MSPSTESRPLSVLLVEDSESDAKLVIHQLRRSGFAPRWERVVTAPALEEALRRGQWHLVLSDSSVPLLPAAEALALAKRLVPDVPFIVVSGSSPEAALGLLRSGAADAIRKDELHRLGAAVARELARPPPLQIREDERRRIAQELHDQISQLLVAAGFNLEAALAQRGVHRTVALREARTLVEEALARVRTFSLELWPAMLDDGLVRALERLAERHAPWLDVDFDLAEVPDLPRLVATACFRMVEEALTNVARHAAAQLAVIRLRAEAGFVEVSVTDDGKGPGAKEQQGLGLAAMRQRVEALGGTLLIGPAPGRGTTVRARIPL
ncbi:MAG: ATP-binding protein [Myxococcales bacterium]